MPGLIRAVDGAAARVLSIELERADTCPDDPVLAMEAHSVSAGAGEATGAIVAPFTASQGESGAGRESDIVDNGLREEKTDWSLR